MTDIKDIEDIASRIADIIISPDTVTGLINGALTVPLDLGYLVRGYFDTDSRHDHQTQRIRMATAIRHDILNYDNIINSVKLIFKKFNKYLSESEQDKVYRAVVSSVAGRLLATNIASKIAAAVLTRVSFMAASDSKLMMAAVTFTLLIGGMSERSIMKSEALGNEDPEIYELLRPNDYDLLYFLIEPAVKPFVDAIHVRVKQGRPAFDKIIESVGRKINAAR